MMKFLCAVLFLALGCASQAVTPAAYDATQRKFSTVEDAVSHLAVQELLESRQVGIDGSESRGFIAFSAILGAPRARQHFLWLVRRGSVVGKIYGLIGLHQLDPAAYSKWEPIVLRDHGAEPIPVIFGCVGESHSVNEIITGSNGWPIAFRDGAWSREYARPVGTSGSVE